MIDEKEDLTLTFKALSHPIRREILDFLKEGPKTTGFLSEQFANISRYAVMKHLSLLEDAELVIVRREGRIRENYLNAVPLQQIYDRWMNQYQSNIASSMLNLKSKLERGTETMEKNSLKHDSFQIEQKITIHAPVSKVFESLTKDINDWWAYRLCGNDSILSFEPTLGGNFIETGSDNNAALWGTVNYIEAPYEIRLQGLLGMKGAVNSSYTFKLEENGDNTTLTLSHDAVGLLDPEWRNAHEGGWEELLGKFLKAYVEEGKKYQEVGE